MIALILRIALGTLGFGFLVWCLYITYLGLKEFFKQTSSDQKSGR